MRQTDNSRKIAGVEEPPNSEVTNTMKNMEAKFESKIEGLTSDYKLLKEELEALKNRRD
jgi:hypothetical protein